MLRRLVMAAVGLVATAAFAGTVTIPHTFTADTPAVAAEVNANFNAVAAGVNDNAADIATLQSQVQALLARVTTLESKVSTLENAVAGQQTTIASLTSELDTVKSNSVLELDGYLSLGQTIDPVNTAIVYPAAMFKGINVQIVNGLGTTQSINGLGNLTIGYNRLHDLADMFAYPFCSKGEYTLKTTCEANGGIWARDQRSGSHSLVLGEQNSYTQYGGVVVGLSNVNNGQHASITAGSGNTASARFASISGGGSNKASSIYASVSGGGGNVASGQFSSVSGGQSNIASGNQASVGGGRFNTAAGAYSSVSGGLSRNVAGSNQWRAGGLFQAN